MLTLQTLYFEDLSVGMTEQLTKTVASSDVVGFAEVTGDRNPIPCGQKIKTAGKTRGYPIPA
jgi:3-hydroxybutyryl-CoA dehydratase